ncbi:MAG: Do family serine endopeptidase [Paludibacteraceae bacterium]|nr:Do family serine endopeptidase [Paludibacteraceae bacterium]
MKKIFSFLGVVLLIAAVSAGTTLAVLHLSPRGSMDVRWTSNRAEPFVSNNGQTSLSLEEGRGEVSDFTQAAELSINAVVHVKTTYRNQVSSQQMDFFEFFFGRPGQQREMPAQQASGSGVIISEDGYIVTNNHVIDRADQILVVLNDKREYTATLVGTDPNTDIALLKIEETGLPVILMGNSDDLRVGEWVLAVGNPFNLTSTVTAGIVSAKARNINILNAEMKIESFIQTDAAVNPGNSGGALVNTRGELVGINTAIASQTGSYSGYSFAVPTSIVRKVVNDIRQYGVVQRAILGVQMREITSELKKEKKLTTLQGAYVERVVPDGAAEKAGIKSGDVITRVDDAAVKTGTDLQEHIGRHRPGDVVNVTLLRDGKTMTVRATLTNRDGGTGVISAEDNASVLGATFSELTDAQKERLGINYGLQIKSLKAGKLKSAGVPSDFIILKVNNRSVRTEEDLDDIVRRANSASERDRVLFITGCTPQGRVRYYAVNLAE